jgi:hypothetical protein
VAAVCLRQMVVFLVAPDCWCCIGLLSLSLMKTLFYEIV